MEEKNKDGGDNDGDKNKVREDSNGEKDNNGVKDKNRKKDRDEEDAKVV